MLYVYGCHQHQTSKHAHQELFRMTVAQIDQWLVQVESTQDNLCLPPQISSHQQHICWLVQNGR